MATKRESVLKALRRQVPEQVPFEFSLTPLLHRQFTARAGHGDYHAHYGMFTKGIGLGPGKVHHDYSGYYPEGLPSGTTIDGWGIAHIPGSTAHFTRMAHPMRRFSSAAEVEAYPFPDLDEPTRYTRLPAAIAAARKEGLATVAPMECTIFENAWYLRGMDELLIDFYTDSDIARVLLDRITRLKTVMAARYAAAGIDVIRLGDDVGTQKAMLMDPAMWRKWLKPRLAAVIDAAKQANPEALIFYHSDGNIEAIIPELIEIGIDILNPIQPECMDPVALKEQYGDRLAFWGTIGTQTTMPFGTPDDVRREVRERIRTVGRGGGLFLAPSHVLEPEVPWANIEAFVAAVKEYGQA
jgi:uroporphyrinogen decarboxylase